MIAVRVLAFLSGMAVVVVVLDAAVRTFVLPRGTPVMLSRVISLCSRWCFDRITNRVETIVALTDEQKAERIVGEELRKRGWNEADLKQRRKTNAKKVQIAARLRRETVQTLDWIARRLEMGCRHTLANCLKAAIGYQ